ncbi:MAG: hypothetical protein L6R45_03955 [Anaerolineae bacterium]|nr:hypothetical protein [Anaerolineae bacterium]
MMERNLTHRMEPMTVAAPSAIPTVMGQRVIIGSFDAVASDITGTNFGILTVLETTLNGTGRTLNLDTGSFNAAAVFDGLTSTSGTNIPNWSLGTRVEAKLCLAGEVYLYK